MNQDFKTEDTPNMGSCCGCGKTGNEVRNGIMLYFEAPEPRTGWGCVICGVHGGAVAVLCDDCLESEKMDYVCVGYPGENRRIPIQAYSEMANPFGHDMSKHGGAA
ncbi:MAG: hypothetical protein ACPG7F_00605 [Aggregatilineales bacterium]